MAACFLCSAETRTECDACRSVSFCCDDHGRLHRSLATCNPFRVETKQGVGRCLVATRSIRAGELIFSERPVASGPLHETSPVCLACWKPVDGSYECELCSLPMCSAECAESVCHAQAECSVFAEAKRRGVAIPAVKDFEQSQPLYQCILPLRCLLLKNTDSQHYRAIQSMMDHCDDRPRDAYWHANQINIVRFLLDHVSLEFSEEEVNHVIGVLDVNAFEISAAGRGRGVFPLTALMSHSCISNARYIIQEDLGSECRANVDIAEGEEITDFYVNPLKGTSQRRRQLLHGWFFLCQCKRCLDPSECGSYLDAFKCEQCLGPLLLSEDVGVDAAQVDVTCDHCSKSHPRSELLRAKEALEEDVEAADKEDAARLEELLSRCSRVLMPSHYLVLELKRYLIYVYGRVKGSLLCELSPSAVQRKRDFCHSLLDTLNIILPGLTKERGLTLFELSAVRLFAVRQRLDGDEERAAVATELAAIGALLREAEACLRHERSRTFEHQVMLVARRQIREVDELMVLLTMVTSS